MHCMDAHCIARGVGQLPCNDSKLPLAATTLRVRLFPASRPLSVAVAPASDPIGPPA